MAGPPRDQWLGFSPFASETVPEAAACRLEVQDAWIPLPTDKRQVADKIQAQLFHTNLWQMCTWGRAAMFLSVAILSLAVAEGYRLSSPGATAPPCNQRYQDLPNPKPLFCGAVFTFPNNVPKQESYKPTREESQRAINSPSKNCPVHLSRFSEARRSSVRIYSGALHSTPLAQPGPHRQLGQRHKKRPPRFFRSQVEQRGNIHLQS